MKSYNIYRKTGTTDEEVVVALGLDPALAGTPGINEAAIRKMHKENYEGYVKQGMNPDAALSRADQQAASARQTVKDNAD